MQGLLLLIGENELVSTPQSKLTRLNTLKLAISGYHKQMVNIFIHIFVDHSMKKFTLIHAHLFLAARRLDLLT